MVALSLKGVSRLLAAFGVCAAVFFGAGCDPKLSGNSAQNTANTQPITVPPIDFTRTVTDARGKEIILKAQPKRIVSLSPATTEILFALGIGDRIVGVSEACDYPAEATKKPKIGGAYNMSVEKIMNQTPDLIVAFGTVNAKPIAALEQASIQTFVVDAKTIAEISVAIRLLGEATGTEEQAENLANEMERKLAALQKATEKLDPKPGVLIVHDVDKAIYTTGPGSYIDEAITLAGGKNVIDAELAANTLSPEKGVELVPDVILCAPELRVKLRAIPGWADAIPAVMNNKYFSPSEAGTLTRPGPRLTQAIEELARYLHPDLKLP